MTGRRQLLPAMRNIPSKGLRIAFPEGRRCAMWNMARTIAER